MNVKIQSVKFDADKRLVDFIQAKMDKMDRFVERAIGAQVTLRIDKDDEQGNKVAIVKIDVAGDELLAERRCKTFEEAIDLIYTGKVDVRKILTKVVTMDETPETIIDIEKNPGNYMKVNVVLD